MKKKDQLQIFLLVVIAMISIQVISGMMEQSLGISLWEWLKGLVGA